MILRSLGFFLRIVVSFFFVFALQLRLNGRSLESYLNSFGTTFFVTKTLKKVSQDTSIVIANFLVEENEGGKKQKRAIANQKTEKLFDRFLNRINGSSNETKDSKK
ncbi:MAG: hypothetical protein OXN83_00165 [Oligoflexia bacterium]|nr:hypothetical protein [Oligoflexia bacterium]